MGDGEVELKGQLTQGPRTFSGRVQKVMEDLHMRRSLTTKASERPVSLGL